MHLAGAVGTPVVAIFGATNERHTAPLTASLDHPAPRLAIHDVWCRPCMLRECPLGHTCMRGVSAAQVHSLIP
jgi:heptosyltransferase-2